MLVFIGLGLEPGDLNLKAIHYIKLADEVILDTYTSILPKEYYELIEKLVEGKKLFYAKRSDLEGAGIQRLIEKAYYKNIVILVPGDPFIATVHDAVRVEALCKGIEVIVVNNVSILTKAISRCGLQSYRFGKIVTLVYPDVSKPYSVIEVIYDNLSRNLHTLLLLDLRVEENKFMTIPEAIDLLIDMDYRRILHNRIAVALARLGFKDEYVVADKFVNLRNHNYPDPPHSLIITSNLHPIELDNLRYLCRLPNEAVNEDGGSKEDF